MSKPLPAPAADPSPDDGPRARRPAGAAARTPLTEAEIIQMLQHLNSMVLMRLVGTAQASVIGRNLKTMLEALRQQAATVQGVGLTQQSLETILRDAPHLVSLVEPFLSDDQIAWLTSRPDGECS